MLAIGLVAREFQDLTLSWMKEQRYNDITLTNDNNKVPWDLVLIIGGTYGGAYINPTVDLSDENSLNPYLNVSDMDRRSNTEPPAVTLTTPTARKKPIPIARITQQVIWWFSFQQSANIFVVEVAEIPAGIHLGSWLA